MSSTRILLTRPRKSWVASERHDFCPYLWFFRSSSWWSFRRDTWLKIVERKQNALKDIIHERKVCEKDDEYDVR